MIPDKTGQQMAYVMVATELLTRNTAKIERICHKSAVLVVSKE